MVELLCWFQSNPRPREPNGSPRLPLRRAQTHPPIDAGGEMLKARGHLDGVKGPSDDVTRLIPTPIPSIGAFSRANARSAALTVEDRHRYPSQEAAAPSPSVQRAAWKQELPCHLRTPGRHGVCPSRADDLSETRQTCPNAAKPHSREKHCKGMMTCSIPAEGKLGTRREANGHSRLANRRESARRAAREFARDQQISCSCGTRSDGMQAVVTHFDNAPCL